MERERKVEKALIMPMKAHTVFDTICNNTKHFLDNNIASHSLERSLKQIENAYADCKSANDDVLDLADLDTAENAIKFAAQIQCQLDDMTEKLTLRIGPKDDTVAKRETGTSSNLQLEKIKLPQLKEKFALIRNSSETLKNKSYRISKATMCPTYYVYA